MSVLSRYEGLMTLGAKPFCSPLAPGTLLIFSYMNINGASEQETDASIEQNM